MRIVTLMAVLAGVFCGGMMAGGQAFAEDPAAGSGVTAPEGAPAESAVEGEGEEEGESGPLAEPDTEQAIERVQAYAYDESVLYGPQTPPGMFLRLAEDYLITSEIGTRTIAHIPLWPRGSLRLGPFQLFPYLTTSYTWVDTNLDEDYYDETDTTSYGAVGGGVAGQTVTMNGKATFTFGLDYRYNMYNGGEKESEVMGGAGVRYSFTPRLWVAAGVRWEHLVDPIGIEDRGDAERDSFYPYVDFGLGDALGLGSKVQLEVGVDFRSTNYADSEYETGSYGEWNAHAKVAVPFYQDTTRLYVRYDYFFGDSESDRLNDLSGGHQISGGMEGMIPLTRTGRLEGFAEIGYRQNSYEPSHYYKDGSDYIETDGSDDEGTWTSAVGLRYHLGLKTTVEVHALRSMEYSSHGNYRLVERIDGWLTRMLTRDLIGRVGAFYERSNPSGSDSEGGDSEERWGVGAGLRFVATEFLDLFLDADYTNTSDQNDEDSGYELRLTIGTDIYLW